MIDPSEYLEEFKLMTRLDQQARESIAALHQLSAATKNVRDASVAALMKMNVWSDHHLEKIFELRDLLIQYEEQRAKVQKIRSGIQGDKRSFPEPPPRGVAAG